MDLSMRTLQVCADTNARTPSASAFELSSFFISSLLCGQSEKGGQCDFLVHLSPFPPSFQAFYPVGAKGNRMYLNRCTVQGNLIKNIHIRISVGLPI